MKYYEGMTIHEIAKSLNLPYETVKKRHQRALSKLRRALLLIMILVLLGLIGACGYRILRYYDIVPPFKALEWFFTFDNPEKEQAEPLHVRKKTFVLPAVSPIVLDSDSTEETEESADYSYLPEYGVNLDPTQPAYTLFRASSAENDYVILTLDEAFYMNDSLKLSFTVRAKEQTPLSEIEQSFIDLPRSTLHYDGQTYPLNSTHYAIDDYTRKTDIVLYENLSLISTNNTIDFVLEAYDVSIPFSLVIAEEQRIDTQYYVLKEHGGVMAIPRYENKELILRIYTLNTGKYAILSGLIYGSTGERETGEITISDSEGTVYSGSCIRYRPYSPSTYFDWNFGSVPAGEYTLHIPYLYQATSCDQTIPLDFKDFTNLNLSYEIPDGTVSIIDYEPLEVEPGEPIPGTHLTASSLTSACYWKVKLKYTSNTDTHTITKLFLSLHGDMLAEPDYGSSDESIRLYYSLLKNDISQNICECLVMYDKNVIDETTLSLKFVNNPARKQDSINYRWNEPFNLNFFIE